MKSSLRTLLTGIVDYAGLFPPAQLPLEQAIANYARYRESPEAWMLGRFVCPAAKLANVSAFHDDLLNSGPPFAFSVLGPMDSAAAQCRESLKSALESLKAFCDRHGDQVVANVLEMKVPSDLVDVTDPKATADRLRDIGSVFESTGFEKLTVFFEWGFDLGAQAVATVIEAIVLYNRRAAGWAGFKLRCGGASAQAVPSAEQIAFVIRNAVMNGVPLKATAGLHHPFPHFDSVMNTRMHGFVNVFGAAVMGFVRHLKPDEVVAILNDQNPAHFVFDDTGFHYGAMHASIGEIHEARRDGLTSFGSCSFDEPREALRALGWLP